ncbi:hypothetical protein [Cupriavidus yeoncheonensis]|uniref:hypothetical protein n=1 Tax=Cupriavidus yeoncheonensis TaxID=1462994 RepID=UPI001BAC27C7|nr:hypothetical protein [Cupriavidus yeoncheonensis]
MAPALAIAMPRDPGIQCESGADRHRIRESHSMDTRFGQSDASKIFSRRKKSFMSSTPARAVVKACEAELKSFARCPGREGLRKDAGYTAM